MSTSTRTVHGAFHRERTAKVQHPCGWDCGDPIQPGTRYIRSSLPPFTEPYDDSPHWRSHALHGSSMYDCPRYKDREVSA